MKKLHKLLGTPTETRNEEEGSSLCTILGQNVASFQ